MEVEKRRLGSWVVLRGLCLNIDTLRPEKDMFAEPSYI